MRRIISWCRVIISVVCIFQTLSFEHSERLNTGLDYKSFHEATTELFAVLSHDEEKKQRNVEGNDSVDHHDAMGEDTDSSTCALVSCAMFRSDWSRACMFESVEWFSLLLSSMLDNVDNKELASFVNWIIASAQNVHLLRWRSEKKVD